MHSALSIPELIHHIGVLVRGPDDCRDGRENLLSLAKTNRSIYQTSLPLLWIKLTMLYHLLHLIPPQEIALQKTYDHGDLVSL